MIMSENGTIPKQENPVVKILEQVLADARVGKVVGLALVAQGPQGQLLPALSGPNLAELFFAVSILSDMTKAQIMNPQPRGGIIPARGQVPPFKGFKG